MSTTVLGIFGHPVAHSKSPAMHGAAIRHLGLDATYMPFDVHPDALGDAVRGIRAMSLRGVNVTLPHKIAVMAYLDAIDPAAEAIGAVNTIIHTDGHLEGRNTDAPGLVRSLEHAGVALEDKTITVLGAGGAVRAAVVGFAQAGARKVQIAARRSEASEGLASALRPKLEAPIEVLAWDDLAPGFEGTDVLIQGTSATLKHSPHAEALAAHLPLAALPEHAVVSDMVYDPLETTVMRDARLRGLETVDGVGMLLHQGALAFEAWLGVEAPVEVMRQALLG